MMPVHTSARYAVCIDSDSRDVTVWAVHAWHDQRPLFFGSRTSATASGPTLYARPLWQQNHTIYSLAANLGAAREIAATVKTQKDVNP